MSCWAAAARSYVTGSRTCRKNMQGNPERQPKRTHMTRKPFKNARHRCGMPRIQAPKHRPKSQWFVSKAGKLINIHDEMMEIHKHMFLWCGALENHYREHRPEDQMPKPREEYIYIYILTWGIVTVKCGCCATSLYLGRETLSLWWLWGVGLAGGCCWSLAGFCLFLWVVLGLRPSAPPPARPSVRRGAGGGGVGGGG